MAILAARRRQDEQATPPQSQPGVQGEDRGSIYYLPLPVSIADLAIMRRIDELHLLYPFAGSRMLRDLLRQECVEQAWMKFYPNVVSQNHRQRLGVNERQRPAQQRVVTSVDLTDEQRVRRSPTRE